ncbi:MAG: MAPEG family protein [Pseudomonadota bacterium]
MTLTISPIYAAFLGLLLIVLSARVILYRRANLISVGDAGDRTLIKRMRVQANCAEYAPIGILLLVVAELSGAPAALLHIAGLALVLGRVIHAYGFGRSPQIMGLRVGGMMLTLIMIGATSLGIFVLALL